MRTRIKKVYYCEFCTKHSLRSLITHEQHCTLNPNRVCGLCKRQEPLSNIIQRLKSQMSYSSLDTNNCLKIEGIKQPSLDDIRTKFDYNCPVCILSTIRLTGLNKFPYTIEFDYKKEISDWWTEINSMEQEKEEWSLTHEM